MPTQPWEYLNSYKHYATMTWLSALLMATGAAFPAIDYLAHEKLTAGSLLGLLPVIIGIRPFLFNNDQRKKYWEAYQR